MAGGVALNVVANSYLAEQGPFEHVWVQPAAGDAGTALGAALYVAKSMGDAVQPMASAALGRGWSDAEIQQFLETANVYYTRPRDIAEAVAEVIAQDGIVAWFQGRSEYGPRALGHRSLLANPRHADTLRRLNDVKGREQFRPVAPMTLLERAPEIFSGPFPSPYMLFVHTVKPQYADRLGAVIHVDGTARVQTVDRAEEPLVARMLDAVERRTGVAGGGQHLAQHRRPADGGRSARRAGVLRLGAGRRAGDRAVPARARELRARLRRRLRRGLRP